MNSKINKILTALWITAFLIFAIGFVLPAIWPYADTHTYVESPAEKEEPATSEEIPQEEFVCSVPQFEDGFTTIAFCENGCAYSTYAEAVQAAADNFPGQDQYADFFCSDYCYVYSANLYSYANYARNDVRNNQTDNHCQSGSITFPNP